MADTYYQICWTGEVTDELMRQYAGTSRKLNDVTARVKEKRKRLAPEDMPTFIVIVEFSNPYAKVVKE